MANLDNRIANADQLLTQDVEKFCDTLGELYSNICKVRDFTDSVLVYCWVKDSLLTWFTDSYWVCWPSHFYRLLRVYWPVILQPILDISLYVYQLTESIGARGPLTMLGYLALSGMILTRWDPH